MLHIFGWSLFVLCVIFVNVRSSYSAVYSQCSSNCQLVKNCTKKVLTCGKGVSNMTVLEQVNCTRNNDVFVVGSKASLQADFIDPMLFKALLGEGMRTINFGIIVRSVSRYTLHLLSNTTPVTLIFNGYYLRYIEPLSFEMSSTDLVLYDRPDPSSTTDKVATYDTACDSKSAPCLCKRHYNVSNGYLNAFSYYYNETSNVVCKKVHVTSCNKLLSCLIPNRSDHLADLNNARLLKPSPDNYCSLSIYCRSSLSVVILSVFFVFLFT